MLLGRAVCLSSYSTSTPASSTSASTWSSFERCWVRYRGHHARVRARDTNKAIYGANRVENLKTEMFTQFGPPGSLGITFQRGSNIVTAIARETQTTQLAKAPSALDSRLELRKTYAKSFSVIFQSSCSYVRMLTSPAMPRRVDRDSRGPHGRGFEAERGRRQEELRRGG